MHPPSIELDNNAHEKWTVVTIDSANRPGSLIYVSPLRGCQGACTAPGGLRGAIAGGGCPRGAPRRLWAATRVLPPPPTRRAPPAPLQIVQHLTELDLRITSARISSDGGWFVDGERAGLHCPPAPPA